MIFKEIFSLDEASLELERGVEDEPCICWPCDLVDILGGLTVLGMVSGDVRACDLLRGEFCVQPREKQQEW